MEGDMAILNSVSKNCILAFVLHIGFYQWFTDIERKLLSGNIAFIVMIDCKKQ